MLPLFTVQPVAFTAATARMPVGPPHQPNTSVQLMNINRPSPKDHPALPCHCLQDDLNAISPFGLPFNPNRWAPEWDLLKNWWLHLHQSPSCHYLWVKTQSQLQQVGPRLCWCPMPSSSMLMHPQLNKIICIPAFQMRMCLMTMGLQRHPLQIVISACCSSMLLFQGT